MLGRIWSRLLHGIAGSDHPLVSLPARYLFALTLRPDLSEAVHTKVSAYRSLGELFARPLVAGARPPDTARDALLSPADGRVSGTGVVLQSAAPVRGKHGWLPLETFLGDPRPRGGLPSGAVWMSIYLPASGYHRVHTPCAAALEEVRHIPGHLAGVRPRRWTREACDRAGARWRQNERLVCRFRRVGAAQTDLVMVLVGAAGVGSMHLAPGVRPAPAAPAGRGLDQCTAGAEFAQFRLGSTVVVIAAGARMHEHLVPGTPVQAGQRIGTFGGHGAARAG